MRIGKIEPNQMWSCAKNFFNGIVFNIKRHTLVKMIYCLLQFNFQE